MRRGYLVYKADGELCVDRKRATSSTLVTELLLREVKKIAHYAQGRLLDVGCGKSPYQSLFEPYISSYIRTDLSTSKHNLEGIDFYSSVLALPLQDKSFDTVLCSTVLEHLYNLFKGLYELLRVTKPNGIIIVIVLFLYTVHGAPFDYLRFTESFLKMYAQKENLGIVELIRIGGALAVMCDTFVKLSRVVIGSERSKWLRLIRRLLEAIFVYLPQRFILSLKRDILSDIFTIGYIVVFKKV